ncbi:MAG: hypothetical protein FRX49_01035 [Trebouxia sp. A1-2]|nr:MAG: hypothetical protein FRX49_01035 [Trebouxia sp. A1-2]
MPLQWEESKATYIHKRAMYYRLHQEMEGAKTQLKGWRKWERSHLKATAALLAQLDRAHRSSAGVAVADAKLELQDTPAGRNPPGVVVVSKYTMFNT